jgi:hypothetical protein
MSKFGVGSSCGSAFEASADRHPNENLAPDRHQKDGDPQHFFKTMNKFC